MNDKKIDPELLHLIELEEIDKQETQKQETQKQETQKQETQKQQKPPQKPKDTSLIKYIIIAAFALASPLIEIIVLLNIL